MACRDMKELTLIQKMNEKIDCGINFCSFEITPPRNVGEISTVLKSVDVIKRECDPLFCSITWHLRGLPSANNLIPHIFDVASTMNDLEFLLHIAASGLSEKMILEISKKALELGINNIFALRGEKAQNGINDFPHAVHLVKFLRKHFGRSIGICVAGYPGGHPESLSYKDDLNHLKEKVDAGTDFIITQIVYDADVFEVFVDKCRAIGITIPIIPGIMPIESHKSLERISKMCHVDVPKKILDILEPIKDNNELVQNFGISYAVGMAKKILLSKRTYGVHFFTMNREKTAVAICRNLGFGSQSIEKPLYPTVENEMKSEED